MTGQSSDQIMGQITGLFPRRVGWERRLQDTIAAARTRTFAWGRHDCATWVFGLRADLTGGADVAALWRGRYSTAAGAARTLRRLGWVDLEAMARGLLGEPLATPRLAQRGDIVLGGTPEAFGICVGRGAAFLTPEGLAFLPLTQLRLAWRI